MFRCVHNIVSELALRSVHNIVSELRAARGNADEHIAIHNPGRFLSLTAVAESENPSSGTLSHQRT